MGNKLEKICFCINERDENLKTEEKVINSYLILYLQQIQKITMHNIYTIPSQNNIFYSEDNPKANTSRQSRNIPKQFFSIKNETNSHRSTYTTSDSIYIGNYINNKRNGQGKLILSDKSYYEGNFKDGLYDGNGYFKNKNFIYKGEFSKGKKHGKGKLENLIKNTVYEGEFKNDKKNGYGIEKYNDGSIYKGNFKNDKKEGMGVLTLKNNSVYEGQFKQDKICGKGIFKWNEKKIYNGEWDNNEISGFGVLIENNIKHIGYFSHDKKERYGASFYTDKNFVLIGKWVNDIIEGIAIIISLNIFNGNNNSNLDYSNKNEKIVMMKEGNIINPKLKEEEIIEIKKNKEYNEMMQLYKEKFISEYNRSINIS